MATAACTVQFGGSSRSPSPASCSPAWRQAQAQTKSETKSESRSDHLRGGWYPWDPYQYRDYKHGVPVLTGFDVEIERASRALWPSRLICRKSPGRSTWRR